MKEVGTMAGRRSMETDDDAVMETEDVADKIKSSTQVSDDNIEVDEVEGRDDGSSFGNSRGEDNEREGYLMKTKPSSSRKPRSKSASKGRRPHQEGNQAQYQGRGGPYVHPAGPRNPPNGPPYPHPPYGYPSGGAPHDPYRGGPPPPPPHPHYHQAPPVPYSAPPAGPFHPGAAYHPMSGHPSGPAYRVPQYPPSSHPYPGYHPGHHQGAYPTPSDCSSSSSVKSRSSDPVSSKGSSKGPSKKRTINGVHVENNGSQELSSYPFRRSGSNASTSSTVTAGNNTSTETPYLTEDSPHRARSRGGSELPPMSSANLFEDADQLNQMNRHRRNNSTASTASSLSVGGFSLSSYEKPRGNGGGGDSKNYEDSALIKASPKKRKSSGNSLPTIDTGTLHRRATSNSSHSLDVAGAPSRFQKLSMEDGSSKPPSGAAEAHRRENSSRNLFLTMSTSPINCEEDVEATPSIKNTKKGNAAEQAMNSFDRGGDTPTPTEAMAERDMMTNEHMLNQHLRSQSFTPLSHLANGSENERESVSNSPTMNSQSFSAIAPQLSWSIAGDAPSLADLTDWEEDIQHSKSNSEHKRDNSMVSKGSTGPRGMATSPQSFGMWKEDEGQQKQGALSPSSDIAMNEEGANVESTPLPVFYGHPVSSEERENVMKANPRYVSSSDRASRMQYQESSGSRVQPQYGDAEHIHHMFLTNGGRGSSTKNNPFRTWSSDFGRKPADSLGLRLPPTPVYSDHHDEGFGRSPHNGDGHPNFFSASNIFGPGMHNDRVRNLRGRVLPGGHPMQLQIPPQNVSHHHNLTSPIGIGSNGKSGMWGGLHSPHHMPHVDMNASKRKCIPLKPPIPSKFQGDIEKTKTAKVPEFANLVNFPNHMSQKQSVNLPEGMRCCVMCGQACPCSASNKNKKGDKKGKDGGLAPRNSNGQDSAKEKQNNGYAIIPTQNKGLCTMCDVNVWVVTASGLEIKWCKGCKNFRPWAAFGDKGLATKCLRCRERQREKYALQKEEKERARIMSKGLHAKTAKA